MSEFDDKLSALLSDPGSMARIMELAQSLSGGDAPPEPPPPPRRSERKDDPLSALTGGLDPALIGRFLPLIQELGQGENSSARALLTALRPYLKPERQERVERALQLARMICLGKRFLANWEG